MSERDDLDLQRHLGGDSDVHRAYDALPKDEPPQALDAAILAAAHSEAARPTRPAWLLPLSVAATVVLGVGLTLQQLRPPASQPSVTQEGASRVSQQASAPPQVLHDEIDVSTGRAQTSTPAPAPEALNELLSQVREQHAKQNADRDGALDNEPIFAELLVPEPPSDPLPPATRRLVDTVPQSAPEAELRQAAKAAQTPRANVVDDRLAKAEQSRGRQDAEREVAAVPRALSQELGTEIAQDAGIASAGDEADTASAFAPAPPASDVRGSGSLAAVAGVADSDEAGKREANLNVTTSSYGASVAATPAAAADESFAVAGALSGAYDDAEEPDATLERIRELHDAGRKREAKQLFERFAKDNPDYEIPEAFPYQRR